MPIDEAVFPDRPSMMALLGDSEKNVGKQWLGSARPNRVHRGQHGREVAASDSEPPPTADALWPD
jgi:hypothetical protein